MLAAIVAFWASLNPKLGGTVRSPRAWRARYVMSVATSTTPLRSTSSALPAASTLKPIAAFWASLNPKLGGTVRSPSRWRVMYVMSVDTSTTPLASTSRTHSVVVVVDDVGVVVLVELDVEVECVVEVDELVVEELEVDVEVE